MKRQTQTVGVRKWAGDDLVSLQSETLKALDAFFAEYGPCVIQGCEITVSAEGSGTYDVAEGLVALMADDQQGGKRVMVMPFAGAEGVALPLYLTAAVETISEAYGDGKVKPIAYSYKATAVGAEPGEDVPYLTLTEAGGNRFVDVVQDEGHRFITDNERAKWNAILQQAKEYADSVAATGSAAALRSAKEYTDQREEAILAEVDIRDDEMLKAAKAYVETVLAAYVGSAPETLDTLQELAAALGNDPNFSATVMQLIGERVTTEAMNNALSGTIIGKGWDSSLNVNDVGTGFQRSSEGSGVVGPYLSFGHVNYIAQLAVGYTLYENMANNLRFRTRDGDTGQWNPWKTIYHSGNFDPSQYFKGTSIGYLYDLETFSDRATGLYQVHAAGASRALLKLNVGTGSASGLELLWDYENKVFSFRTTIDSNRYGAWRNIYHDGNLGEATSSAAGLMSAADKTKLDGIAAGGMKLLGAGVFDFNSLQLSKKTGCVLSGYRNGVGNYRISHNIGHTNYEVQATCSPTNGHNGYASIRSKTATYFDVYTGDDQTENDLSFFFQIYEFV